MRAEPRAHEGQHVGVAHGIPHSVRADDNKLPLRIDMKRLNLGHRADDLLPWRFVMIGFQKEVTEASRRNQDSADPEAKQSINKLKPLD